MKDVPKQTHLFRRGSVYYFRCRVPADLFDHYGKAEIKRSLHTSSHKQALELVRLQALKQDQEFQEIRRQRDTQPITTTSALEIDRLTSLWLHDLMEEDEAERMRGVDDRGYRKAREALDVVDAGGRYDLARGDTSHLEFEIDDFLDAHGVVLDKGSEGYRKFSYAMLKAWVKATDMMRQRHAGEAVDTPPAPPSFLPASPVPASASDDNPRLSALFECWAVEHEGKRAPGTIPEFRISINRFVEVNGDLPVRAIEKGHVRAFKDAMLRLPSRPPSAWRGLTVPQIIERAAETPAMPKLSARTINDKMLGALNAVLNWAVREGYLEYNPAMGMKAVTRRLEEDRKQPFTLQELNLIFRFPIFTEGERPKAGAGEAAKWLPLLGLFTGARREELGQLLTAEVKEEQGISYLDLFTISDGQQRKTQSSRRRVPIHPELVRLGFLAYVEQRRKAGDERLFPDLLQYRGKWTTLWGKWWGQYARKRGLKDTHKAPFHAFRHTVKAAYRLADVEEVVYDALQGHFPRSTGREYGGNLTMSSPLEELAEAMGKLQFPGLDLEHLIE